MRVSIIGQAAFGEAVFHRLQDDGIEIAGVSAPAPDEGGKPDPLWAAAEQVGLPLVATRSLREEGGIEAWASIPSDLCVMAFVTEILPERVFSLAAQGTVQYHPSLLPRHRGMSSMNWPIIFGERETGLTIFWPDEGIDTGPVLLQKRQAIGPDETMGSLYFNHLFPMGVDAMAEAVGLVARGEAPRIPQEHEQGTYEPPCREEHARIQWHEPVERVYALIRGCNPQPGAWMMHGKQRVKVFDCRLTGEMAPGMPGRILKVDDEGFEVRLNGGVLRALRVQPERGPKQPAGAWAAEAGLHVGERLG
jgi:methionyl-tRNA formyltransferase